MTSGIAPSPTPPGEAASPIEEGLLAGIDRRSAIDAVRLRISTAILLGLLRPGERLPDQKELALGLSVSAITARRALTDLAEQGILARRRGRGGGTFVADDPPRRLLQELTAAPEEFTAIHRLVDRRLLFECAVTHYAALNASVGQLEELERLTVRMAAATDWSEYHQADDEFHRLVAAASGMGTAVNEYNQALAGLYAYFLPYPIEHLHNSNRDHIRLVAALRSGDATAAVDISRQHVAILHRTMFMGLMEENAPAKER